jgi:hypothetical protein
MAEVQLSQFKVTTQAILEICGFCYKRSSTSVHLEVDDTHLLEPCKVAEEFDKHFQLVYCHLYE